METIVTEKKCSKCGQVKTLSEFNKQKLCKYGVRPECKKCKYKNEKAWKSKNTERVREYMRSYGREHEKTYCEIRRARERQRYVDNPQAILARNRKYTDRRPEVQLAIGRNYRAKKRANGGCVSPDDWSDVLERYGHRCLNCGATERIEQDHVIPISRGGIHHKSNLQPLCKTCNVRKGTRAYDYRFDKGAAWMTE